MRHAVSARLPELLTLCNDRSDPYASRLASPAHKWRLRTPTWPPSGWRVTGQAVPVPEAAVRPKSRPAVIAAVLR